MTRTAFPADGHWHPVVPIALPAPNFEPTTPPIWSAVSIVQGSASPCARAGRAPHKTRANRTPPSDTNEDFVLI